MSEQTAGKRRRVEGGLGDTLRGKEDELDLAALDGLLDEAEADGPSEMLSFRVPEAQMRKLRDAAEALGVGHTILAREVLLDGLRRLRLLEEPAEVGAPDESGD